MRRTVLNFITDFAALLMFLGLITTGLIVRYTLPQGTGGRLALWGMNRHDWGGLHFWIAVSLAVLVLLHVALHWTWVCGLVKRWTLHRAENCMAVRPVRRVVYGVLTIAALALAVGSFLWYASISVTETRGRGVRSAAAVEGTRADERLSANANDDAADDPRGKGRGDGRGEGRGWRGGRGQSEPLP